MFTSHFAPLADLWSEIEEKCFFELAEETRALVKSLEESNKVAITAWSFVPHPEILARNKRLDRYIVTIDTISSQVYFPVVDFLRSQKANVSAYYSGGWADFVCDVQFEENRFERWWEELRQVLENSDAQRFCPTPSGVNSLISAFKVKEPLMLCRQPVSDAMKPGASILRDIEKNLLHFEMMFRNYCAPSAIAAIGGEVAVRNYLRRLKDEGAILCFRAVTDVSRFAARDYIALRVRHRLVDGLLQDSRTNLGLLRPVEEFLYVDAIKAADKSEEEIDHILINSYDMPGQRIDWKLDFYKWSQRAGKNPIDVNIYNYPLEGAVTETPIYLTDYPEFLARMEPYDSAENRPGIFIGRGSHPSAPAESHGSVAKIPVSGLGYHGITIGGPGSGKTNTDLVLAVHMLPHVKNIILLDSTQGVWNKLDGIPPNISDNATKIVIDAARSLKASFAEAVSKTGLVIMEISNADKHPLHKVLDFVIDFIEQSRDLTKANQPRAVQHVLMVEEAADAWLGKGAHDRARSLRRMLQKAWRKGWCIWLSTQDLSELGPDDEQSRSLLNTLQNRIIHGVTNAKEEALLLDVLKDEGHSEEDAEYVQQQIRSSLVGLALVRAVAKGGKSATLLPPVYVKIPLLHDAVTTSP